MHPSLLPRLYVGTVSSLQQQLQIVARQPYVVQGISGSKRGFTMQTDALHPRADAVLTYWWVFCVGTAVASRTATVECAVPPQHSPPWIQKDGVTCMLQQNAVLYTLRFAKTTLVCHVKGPSYNQEQHHAVHIACAGSDLDMHSHSQQAPGLQRSRPSCGSKEGLQQIR